MGCVFSMYIFPFSFTFLPIGNTKIYEALLGLGIWVLQLIRGTDKLIGRQMVVVSVWAMIVSLISLCSLAYNNATDTAYTGYIISMWVWSGAAYFVCSCIKKIHGSLNVVLICHYFIGVCVAQCVVALLNEFVPVFNAVINKLIINENQAYLISVDRMYGIGAAFDTAGTRFSCALIMISYCLSVVGKDIQKTVIYAYILSFVFISVVGNMVARTTSAGMMIGVAYLIYANWSPLYVSRSNNNVFKYFLCVLVAFLPLLLFVYSIPEVKPLLDFAFEGFFAFVETGTWETHSTNELLHMWTKTPDLLKTWIIGDGYFLSPHATNPYYVGDNQWAYYMGTDVGYLRFIFYFGLLGLSVFALFFIFCTRACVLKFPRHRFLFYMILLMNLVIWAKVSTDLYCVFALFLMSDSEGMGGGLIEV